MRLILIMLFGLLMGHTKPHEARQEFSLAVQPASTVSVDGTTNVNKFQCAISRYTGTDTLVFTAGDGKGAKFSKGYIRLAVAGFDCGPKLITKDFTKTINAEKYPYLAIEFVSFENDPQFEPAEKRFRGLLKVSLAAATVPVTIKCGLKRDEKGLIYIDGSHTFTFADFNLTPPTRMLGAVKVQEDLVVNFHLVLVKV